MPSSTTSRSWRYAASVGDVGVVAHVLVAVGHHRAAPVPPPVADDVHLGGQEGVGAAHDRADVEVVLPVLDRDVEVVATGVEVGDDRLHRPVAVAVDDVAPVALGEQLRVVLLTLGPRPRPTARRPTSGGPCGIGSYGARLAPPVGERSGIGPTARWDTAATVRCGGYRDRVPQSSRGAPAARHQLDGPQTGSWTEFGPCVLLGQRCCIVFIECGLFFPFLPGDTLLFALGLFIAGDRPGRHRARRTTRRAGLRTRAAHRGRVPRQRRRLRDRPRRSGHRSTSATAGCSRRSTSTRPGVLRQARQQGAGHRPLRAVRADLHHGRRRRDPMDRRRFFVWSAVGAVLWVCSITLLGYFLGTAVPGSPRTSTT